MIFMDSMLLFPEASLAALRAIGLRYPKPWFEGPSRGLDFEANGANPDQPAGVLP